MPDQADVAGSESGPISGEGEGHWLGEGPRWFRVTATGDIQTEVIVPEFQLTGGCSGGSPINMGFLRGDSNSEDYAYLSFETAGPVRTAETGSFELEQLVWDYGTTSPANMPANLNIRVPNRFTGSGTLTLAIHSPSQQDRRMEGSISAAGLSNKSGQIVDIEATFRVDWSCGIR